MKNLIKLLIVIAIGFAFYGAFKGLPEGTNVAGEVYDIPSTDITFLQDRTYVNDEGVRFSDQEIFDELFSMIRGARSYVLLDMFLFNEFLGAADGSYRSLSRELTDVLLEKKESNPNVTIVVITDPINTIYGGYPSPHLRELQDAGIEVVITDLSKLPDSNPIASGFWRAYFSWFGNSTREGYLPNVFDVKLQKLGLRTYMSLFNFKANHRKVVVVDSSKGMSVLLTSANPHDGSSAHTNVALRVDSMVWKDVLESEFAVGVFSNEDITRPSADLISQISNTSGNVQVQLLTEEKIRDTLIAKIAELRRDDTIDMSMFYLSDRRVIQAIKAAVEQGVQVRLLLDPNKDAFGRTKNGIPNRQVASELKNFGGTIEIRWCHTHGEQCHSKLVLLEKKDTQEMFIGSANLTRRNIGGYNLESNFYLASDSTYQAFTDAKEYFDDMWNNEVGKIYSTEYETYADESTLRKIQYRFMEDLGISSF